MDRKEEKFGGSEERRGVLHDDPVGRRIQSMESLDFAIPKDLIISSIHAVPECRSHGATVDGTIGNHSGGIVVSVSNGIEKR